MLLWCVSNTDHSTNVLYSGLDVRFLDQLGPTYFSDSVAILRDALERAIEFCTVSYAKGDLDVNAAHSLLFCRAVALSLRAIPTAETPLDSTASTGNERYINSNKAVVCFLFVHACTYVVIDIDLQILILSFDDCLRFA
jgi:hypothetical protein